MFSLQGKSFDTVIYHFPCKDGFVSYLYAHKYMLDNFPDKHVDYFTYNYELTSIAGHELDDFVKNYVVDKNVLMLDITVHTNMLGEFVKVAKGIFIVDHHKTTLPRIGTMIDDVTLLFDKEKSGAKLTYQAFNDSGMCRLVEMIEDWDLWRFRYAETKKFNAYLDTLNFNEELYLRCDNANFNFNAAFAVGKEILKYNDVLVEQLSQTAKETNLFGCRTLVVNSPIFGSLIGHYLCEQLGADIALVWYYNEKEEHCKISLRTNDKNIDVETIAKNWPGGGGHRPAAGFSIKGESIEQILRGTEAPIMGSNLDDVCDAH